ncbi:MAG: hypothetical protein KGQ46_09800 [Hyphomicrobiales bacterium]|nr:hypothetical protein [Hyphomicrobiales bacterium]MDE2115093.1 hypothetical protein [Hyphomicrobiales bacterium]
MALKFRHLAWLLLLLPACANAASLGECMGWADLAPTTRISLMSVRKGGPVHFLNNASEQKGCPAAGAKACQRKDYLVSGDPVLVNAREGEFSCGEYVNAKGLVRAGWLPTAALVAAADAGSKDFSGQWRGNVEQKITIKVGKAPGMMVLHGDATFGALDPDRVKRGGVNIGSFDATARSQGDSLAFTADEGSGTLPYDKGDAMACRIRMRRLGPFLLVEDNRNCGGNNVSFTGDYRRK